MTDKTELTGRDAVQAMVGRLVATTYRFTMGVPHEPLINPDGPEAAALLTAQQAEIERLEAENAYLRGKLEGHAITRAALAGGKNNAEG